MKPDKDTIIYHRLERHCFNDFIANSQYFSLFKLLQPVCPTYNSYPGSPPSLSPRGMYFDDTSLNDILRGDRRLVKGRFAGGSVGYVFKNDLDLYANAFHKPLGNLSYIQKYIFDVVKSSGPLTAKQIKEDTGFLNKEIMPVLHRFQKAFWVYEDQPDNDWDRAWYIFEREIPDVEINEKKRIPSIGKIIIRLLKANVFLTFYELKNTLQMSKKLISQALDYLLASKKISRIFINDLGDGYILSQDLSLKKSVPLNNIFVLHQGDPLVVLEKDVLKNKFYKKEVLQYLMIDGYITGALLGHWQIKAHDISDIEILLQYEKCKSRYREIEEAVYNVYSRAETKIRKFCGRNVKL